MIRVRCIGHIASSVGSEEILLQSTGVRASELIEDLRMRSAPDSRPGFTKYNTLMIVNDGEAFTPASDDRQIADGDTVTLVPFSHGG